MKSLVCFLSFLLFLWISDSGGTSTNNRCVYNVTLGQCQFRPPSSPGSQDSISDCDGVEEDMTLLKLTMAGMSRQIQELQSRALGPPPPPTPQPLLEDTEQILYALGQTEQQYSSSNSQLATVIRQAADEIQHLQNELATCRVNQNCNGNRRTTTTSLPTPVSTNGGDVDYKMTLCDFESSSQCGYTLINHTAEWYRGQGTRWPPFSGPVDDHTLGTPSGYYMYIDPRKSAIWFRRQDPVPAYLESTQLDPAPNYCIRFWYHMLGANTKDLKVYAKVGTGLGYPVWTRSGQQGNNWILGEIELSSEYTSKHFSLVFEATTESYYEHVFASHPRYHDFFGYISIDDIYTYNTKCKNLQSCPPGTYIRRGANSTSCYTFHTSASTWRTGHLTCKHETAMSHLVAVNSKNEQDYLVNIIKNNAGLKAAGESGFYTSGNDEEKESDFRWTGEGNPYGMSYTNWYPGQPNNVGANQHCVLLQYPDADFQWGDIECQSSHPFICEVDLPSTV